MKKQALLDELRKRTKEAKEASLRPKFVLKDFCFDKQFNFITDPSKFKTAVCSRRSGKTVACAADLIYTATENKDVNVVYITLNRKSAKRIVWKDLLKINKNFQLGGKVDNSELTITFPNDSTIHISGAKDESEIEKFRGMALKKVYIDESQSFRPYIKNLIDDVIVPALYDHDGSLALIGTPGPVAAGYFYEVSHNPAWANHKWTIYDNPWIEQKSGKKVDEILKAELARRGVTKADPTYRRESLGEWVHDNNALVYHFDPSINLFNSLPEGRMTYILGIDIGFNDADAIAVLGYNDIEKKVYLVEEWVKNKQNITELVNKINQLRTKYNPVKMVMDAGALGKKIQEEIRTRHSLNIEAAEKTRKLEFIELLNDDLRTGKFKARPKSRFEEDSYLVQWDYSNAEKPKISDSYHTDIGDAVLYAWRACAHFLSEVPKKITDRDTDQYMVELEKKEADKIQRRVEDPNWDLWEAVEEDIDDFDEFDF